MRISHPDILGGYVSYRDALAAFAAGVFSLYNENTMTVILTEEDVMAAEVNGAAYYLLRNKPVGLWPLSGDLLDYSGYGRDAVSASTNTHLPLVTSLSEAAVFDNTNTAEFPVNVFQEGQENEAFSLEVSFRTIATTEGLPDSDGEQQVLGHSGVGDGITVNGSVVSFSTKYVGDLEVVVSYDTKTEQNVRACAVHTNEKNSLYINGQLVAEADIPEEIRGLAFVANDGSLYSGASASSRQLAVNTVAVYEKALNSDVIATNYELFSRSTQIPSLSATFGGHDVPVSRNSWDRFIETSWNSQDTWTAGSLLTNAAVVSGNVYPRIESDVTVAGTWMNSVELDSATSTSIYGVNFDWDGSGFVVEVSLDGDLWIEVERLRNVTLVPNGFMPTETILHVRVTFLAGLDPDAAALRSLRVWGFTDGDFILDNVSLSFDSVSPMSNEDYLAFSNDWGVHVEGDISISTAPGSAEVIRTIEVWSRSQDPLTFSGTTSSVFVNGVAGSHVPGEWIITHYVLSADLADTAVISGVGQVGHIVTYDSALTAPDAAAIVGSHFSIDSEVVSSESVISVTEMVGGTEIYAHDWTITGAG